jgi:hypothetical protein
MRHPLILLHHATMAVACTVLISCATTSVSVTPSPQTPVCDRGASALIFWEPQWRPDQKDVPERETAAETGLKKFLQSSGCFTRFELRRLPSMTPATVAAEVAPANGQFDKVIAIALRELGPVIKLLSSPALIDGGTEVVLQVAEYISPGEVQTRAFTVHWQNGGPGSSKAWPRCHKICKPHSLWACSPTSHRNDIQIVIG